MAKNVKRGKRVQQKYLERFSKDLLFQILSIRLYLSFSPCPSLSLSLSIPFSSLFLCLSLSNSERQNLNVKMTRTPRGGQTIFGTQKCFILFVRRSISKQYFSRSENRNIFSMSFPLSLLQFRRRLIFDLFK